MLISRKIFFYYEKYTNLSSESRSGFRSLSFCVRDTCILPSIVVCKIIVLHGVMITSSVLCTISPTL